MWDCTTWKYLSLLLSSCHKWPYNVFNTREKIKPLKCCHTGNLPLPKETSALEIRALLPLFMFPCKLYTTWVQTLSTAQSHSWCVENWSLVRTSEHSVLRQRLPLESYSDTGASLVKLIQTHLHSSYTITFPQPHTQQIISSTTIILRICDNSLGYTSTISWYKEILLTTVAVPKSCRA